MLQQVMVCRAGASLHAAASLQAICACQSIVVMYSYGARVPPRQWVHVRLWQLHGKPHLKVHQCAPVGERSGCVRDGADGALRRIACLLRAMQASKGLLSALAHFEAESITRHSRPQHAQRCCCYAGRETQGGPGYVSLAQAEGSKCNADAHTGPWQEHITEAWQKHQTCCCRPCNAAQSSPHKHAAVCNRCWERSEGLKR